MSTEFINRITVKKDGVYISSHSSNDTAPFHSWRCKGLSEIYAAEGQKGLDREIVCMLYEYAQLRGSHKRITEDTLGIGGAKEKFKANMAAVNLLHDLEIENRLATPEEQKILAGYVGWGGLSMAFDENNAAWANEFKELYVTLSPEEYRAQKSPR